MNLLFASANSRHEYIDVEREQKILQGLIEPNGHALRMLPAVEIKDLRTAISANKKSRQFDVLHLCCHASADRGLHLRGKGHRADYLSGQRLKAWLEGAGFNLLVINACDSDTIASKLSEVVPTVIGTTRKVRDLAARGFTRAFYGALVTGMPISTAFKSALEKQRSTSTPAYVLFEKKIRC